ncbi:MAG: SLC13 family permease [bacterium]|jgi:sodium-dependent dicarboxylate transporter 2/3/5
MRKNAITFFLLTAIMYFCTKKTFPLFLPENIVPVAAGGQGVSSQAIITLLILLAAAISFFTEVIPLAATAMLVPVALSLFNILPAAQAFSYFGDQWVVIFMAMFIIGEAVFRTGFAAEVGQATVKAAGTNQLKLLTLMVITVGLLSAFLNNTGTTAVFIPIVKGISTSAGIQPGKIFMPIAFASSLGGTMTLIGTPPNGLVNSIITDAGLTPFGFFEFAKIGIVFFAAGIAYFFLFGFRLLPDNATEARDSKGENLSSFHYRRNKMPTVIIIFVFIITVMASEIMPLVTASMLGAALVIITGCITIKEAFASVSWTVIFLFAGMLPMSAAMTTSGAAQLVANIVVANINSPYTLLAATYILTALITNFMSNTATAALMAPISLAIANGFGVSPLPVLMGVAMAASACFLTPVATPPNTIVLGPGGYRFGDYVRAGWPLQVLCAIFAIILIPLFWPF